MDFADLGHQPQAIDAKPDLQQNLDAGQQTVSDALFSSLLKALMQTLLQALVQALLQALLISSFCPNLCKRWHSYTSGRRNFLDHIFERLFIDLACALCQVS